MDGIKERERDLTEDEDCAFDGLSDHSNNGFPGNYCCPHCKESDSYAHTGEDRKAITCIHCGQEFVGWVDYEPVSYSAKLPFYEGD